MGIVFCNKKCISNKLQVDMANARLGDQVLIKACLLPPEDFRF